MPEIAVLTPDGQTKAVPLQGGRLGVGRASTNELCFPEDTGLSRQHLVFESSGEGWTIRDVGSKNGTLLNGERVSEPRTLKPGDRISAGHHTFIFDSPARTFQHTVVFVDSREDGSAKPSTVSRSLSDVVPPERTIRTDARTAVSADKIGALVKAGRELATHRPLEELFPLILNLAIEAVKAERGVVLTVEGDSLTVQASSGGNFRISSGVRDRVLKEKASILVNDVLSDDAFRGMQSLVMQQVRMLIAVPLQTNDKVIGLIYVDSPMLVHDFTVDDLNLLTVMANVAAIRIEHARLAEVEQAEKIMANDLEQAAVIQQGLLPSAAPAVPGLDIAGYNVPCRTVGGDYYDFIEYPDGRVTVVLGDVSGKAMPAALLMTSLQARVRVLAEEPPKVADLITRLNRITAANIPSNRFVSLFFSVIDSRNGRIIYSNAGHNPPLLARVSGAVEALEGGGLLLGIWPNAPYGEHHQSLDRGDVLLLFSDGVTEATNSAGDEFGDERLNLVLRESRHKSSQAIISAVTDAVTEFTAGAPAADDLTLVVVKRT